MKQIGVQTYLKEYDSIHDLSDEEEQLLEEAGKVANHAYAPYSRFRVGASVLLENGVVVSGNNQENASYPLGLCAERVALFAAVSNNPDIKIKAIAVTARSNQYLINKPITPCGACRQVIAEYEHKQQMPIRIIMAGESGKVWLADSVKSLLPYSFSSDDLKVKIEL